MLPPLLDDPGTSAGEKAKENGMWHVFHSQLHLVKHWNVEFIFPTVLRCGFMLLFFIISIQTALQEARQVIESQKGEIATLKERVDMLTEDGNFLQERLKESKDDLRRLQVHKFTCTLIVMKRLLL